MPVQDQRAPSSTEDGARLVHAIHRLGVTIAGAAFAICVGLLAITMALST